MAVMSEQGTAFATLIPNIPWPAAMSSTRRGGVGQCAASSAKAPATGAMKGTIAFANFTQIGLSGAILANPGEPPFRTNATGSSRKRSINSGEHRKWMTLPIHAGDVVVRNSAVEGLRL